MSDTCTCVCYEFYMYVKYIWAATCDFQQCGIYTSVDSDEPVQPPFKLRNSKCCSVSNLSLIEYLSDEQRLWSDCAYAQAGLSLCWSHIPHCWKSNPMTHIVSLFRNSEQNRRKKTHNLLPRRTLQNSSEWRARGREFDPSLVIFFCGDWS